MSANLIGCQNFNELSAVSHNFPESLFLKSGRKTKKGKKDKNNKSAFLPLLPFSLFFFPPSLKEFMTRCTKFAKILFRVEALWTILKRMRFEILRQYFIHRGDEKIGVGFGERHRRPDLDYVVKRPVRAQQNPVFPKPVGDE